jgi:hypothetical protein
MQGLISRCQVCTQNMSGKTGFKPVLPQIDSLCAQTPPGGKIIPHADMIEYSPLKMESP